MSITQQGIEGEQRARLLLKKRGYNIFEIDWIAQKKDTYLQVEVKYKEQFNPPPFAGHGLELWKVKKRLAFQQQFGLKAFLLVFDKTDGHTYGQFISRLELGEHFDTKNGIRIYKLDNFLVLE